MHQSWQRRAFLAAHVLSLVAAASAATPRMPTFLARRDYAAYSTYLQVADTNGDGIPDLIESATGYIQVLFGNGDGTFGPAGANTLTVMKGAAGFFATDLNGDGIADLVIAGGSTGTIPDGIAVCLGNGDGTFQPGVFYEVADMYVYNLVIGDFNNDGITDVAIAGQAGVWLFLGRGGGSFSPGVLVASLDAGAGNIAAADFNGDGNLDWSSPARSLVPALS